MTVETITTGPVAHAILKGGPVLDAINWLGFITDRVPVPILGAARFTVLNGVLTVESFDYETHMRIVLGEAEGEDCTVLVQQSLALAALKAMVGRKKAEPVMLAMGPGFWSVNDQPSIAWDHAMLGDYPELPNEAGTRCGDYDVPDLLALFDRLKVAASKDDTLPILTGVHLTFSRGTLTGYSTDRYRLAMATAEAGAGWRRDDDHHLEPSALVKVKHWAKWKRALKGEPTARVAIGEEWFRINAGDVMVQTLKVDGDYPKIRSLFPDRIPNTAEFNRLTLLAAVEGAAQAAERNTPVRLTFTNEGVVLDAGTGEAIQITMPVVRYVGGFKPDFDTIAFNPGYLIDGLKSIDGDTVAIGSTTPPKPHVLASSIDALAGDEHRYLLMPVRLPNS